MKSNLIAASAALAMAGAVLLAPSSAEATLAYNEGDVFLGFRATGGTGASTDYLVNVGSITQFLTATSVINLGGSTAGVGIGNIGADLTTIFSSGWGTRPDVLWSVSGVDVDGGNLMLASRAHAGPNVSQQSTPWNSPSVFAAGDPANRMLAMAQHYALGTTGGNASDQTESANSLFALIQPGSQTNSYGSYQPGGVNTTGSSAFNYFNGVGGIEQSFAYGPDFALLDLYYLEPGSAAQFVGDFQIAPNGNVTFTPQGVPEPAAASALALGALALGCLRRRKARR